MKLNRIQISQVKNLMKDGGWDILIMSLAGYIENLRSEEIVGQNEFETLRALHTRQGKIEGLKDFFDKIERSALE